MMNSSESDAIPLPRLRTVLLCGVLSAIAWSVWGEWQDELDRQALWDSTAPSTRRVQAVEKFAKLGGSAVPELISGLDRGDAQARELAGLALAQIGPPAFSAGSKLVELLADPDEGLRLVALRALPRIGYSLEKEIPLIAASLSAEDPALREEAVHVLTGLGPSVIPAVCQELRSSSAVGRRHSATVLGQVGLGDSAVVEALRACLGDADREVRRVSFRSLAQWDELTLQETLVGMQDAESSTAAAAARHAGRFAEDGDVVLPDLVRLLAHGRSQVRCSALEGLAWLGPPARPAVPEVVWLLQRATLRERPLALCALGRIAAGDAGLVSLVEGYLLETRETSEAVGYALRCLSPSAGRTAALAIATHLAAADGETRVRAAAALDGLGEEARDVIPALVAALDDSSDRVRFHAAGALAQIGPPAESAIPGLANLVRASPNAASGRHVRAGSSLATRIRAIAAIGSVGRNSESAIAVILSAAGSSESAVRAAAVEALVRTACDRITLVELLDEALWDSSDAVRAQAVLGLVQVQADPEIAVPLLESVLRDDDLLVRKAAAAALGEYGAHAASSRDMLEGLASRPGEPTYLDDEEDENAVDHLIGLRRSESAQPMILLARRSMRSIAVEALKKVDGRRRA